jgi:hypothetical protein
VSSVGNQRNHSDNYQRARPAHHHRRHRAPPRRGDARFELAEMIRGTGEQRVHGADAPAHGFRRLQLYQRGADHHTHHVGAAHDGERQQGQRQRSRHAEYNRHHAENRHRDEQHPAHVARERMAHQPERGEYRTQRRCRAQQPQPLRSGVKDVARVDRQQRHRAAEQRGEQIQRNGAEDDRFAEYVMQAAEEKP